jgi:DNA-binding NtrC family response regulator
MVSCERIDQGLGAGQFQGTALWPDHMIHVDTLPVDAVVVLDDVDRLGIPAQTQLLYWMEQMEQVFEALDPARRLPCFISTARRELFRDAAAQTFRPRLYYRLSGMEIVVPPLRERREDITRLAHAFIKEIARQLGTAVPALDDSAMDLLRQPPWPGNVTQFEAVLQRAMAEFAVGRPFADALRNAVLIYSLTEPRPNLRRAPIFV